MDRQRTAARVEPAGAERVAPKIPAKGGLAQRMFSLQSAAGNRAVARMVRQRTLARDSRSPSDHGPVDAVDRAAGGRARYNVVYGRQCEPYWSTLFALTKQAEMLIEVPVIVAAALRNDPAFPEVVAEWRRYLTGAGGLSRHDLTTNPSDHIALSFQRDSRHEDPENAVLGHAWRQSALWLPRLARQSSVTLSFDDLGVPAHMRRPVPDYDNDAFTVAANLAGGVGDGRTRDSDFGPDYRELDGTITVTNHPDSSNRLWSRIFMTGNFVWTIHDAIDFCPGNAGNPVQERWTITMSRLEASGLARDVGLLVKFPRRRIETPRVMPNPAIAP